MAPASPPRKHPRRAASGDATAAPARPKRRSAPKAQPREAPLAASRAARGASLGSFLARGRVLEGAARVFAAHGGSSASVEDLLRASRISRRTFYKMFADKEDVLSALFDVATTLLLDRIREVSAVGSPIEKIEHALDAYLGFNRTSGDLMRVLEAESLRPDSRLGARRASTLEALERFFLEQARLALGMDVEPLVIYGLLMALEGVSRRIHEHSVPSEEDIQRARHAMLRIVLSTLAAPTEPPVPPLPGAR
jgi:AcrR family transcriptional regulator